MCPAPARMPAALCPEVLRVPVAPDPAWDPVWSSATHWCRSDPAPPDLATPEVFSFLLRSKRCRGISSPAHAHITKPLLNNCICKSSLDTQCPDKVEISSQRLSSASVRTPQTLFSFSSRNTSLKEETENHPSGSSPSHIILLLLGFVSGCPPKPHAIVGSGFQSL